MSAGRKETVLKGIGVSPGVAAGPAFLMTSDEVRIVERELAKEEIPREIARFEEALIETRRQLHEIQQKVGEALDERHASLFDAHLLVVDDRSLVEETIRMLGARRRNVEVVLKEVADRYAGVLAKLDDEYLRERAADVRDVTRRILHNLAGRTSTQLAGLDAPCIVVAHDLAPSETATLKRDKVIAFATDQGSRTSHTAIMARALEIPAVVGLHDVSTRVSRDDRVLVDGTEGLVVINPSAERLEHYGQLTRRRDEIQARLQRLHDQPAETRDGYRVHLMANIELPHDVDSVLKYGANGVGLFRTEFLFLSREDLPNEMEQARAYDEVARRMAPAPVVIRTLDIGGDKFASALKMPKEINPFMGARAIRFCFSQPEIFLTQLRAILRASVRGNVHIMYPMISLAEEVDQANELLAQAKASLDAEGVPFDRDIDVGAMIEVPSAALTAHLLAQKVKFFSLGTNDLIQYTLAVDRVNENIAHLYEPTNPAVLRLIHQTFEAAHAAGIGAGVCGEMGGDPFLTPLLIGLGADELSMSPNLIPMVKAVVRNLRLSQAEALARAALASASGTEVREQCRNLVREIAPDMVELLG